VFTRTKHGADRLAKQLAKQGIRTAAIHGNRTQPQRERALALFPEGRVSALVATDVAARGIHVDAVGVVVHFDMAGTDKDYVHRSGRTARAGASGLVVSLVARAERDSAEALQRTLELPRGLHELDLSILTADELPAPTPTGNRGTASQRNRTRGGAAKRSSNGRARQRSRRGSGAPSSHGRDRASRSRR